MKLEPCLTKENMNQNLLNIQYAVRGPLLQRAIQIERELEKGVEKPFSRVVRANIGDCHALGQQPVSFIRQVLALAACPELISSASVPADVKRRAQEILDDCTKGSLGAYSPSAGLLCVRRRVCEYMARRDGVPADVDDVYLGAGASDLIRAVLSLFVTQQDKKSAVMIPIPQYPVFSGTLSELGLVQADYFLDEEHDWALSVEELERSWIEASADANVRALVVINPGNPTGQVLSRENIKEVIRFAHRRRLFILADEVYQENIVSKPFHSFKKVMSSMGEPYASMPLASFVTCSKGWAAECGLRGGYVELLRLPEAARAPFNAARALQQCPALPGQCVLYCVMNPPTLGEESYEQYSSERRQIQEVLTARCAAATHTFNDIPGYSCNNIDGSMFAFPRIEMPPAFVRIAGEQGLSPDELYCMMLLEETGVCVVPGTGFGQRRGTFHLRTTILHREEEFAHMMDCFRRFQRKFLQIYA